MRDVLELYITARPSCPELFCRPMHMVLSMKINLSCHLVSFDVTLRSRRQTEFVCYREESNGFVIKIMSCKKLGVSTSQHKSLPLVTLLLTSSKKVTRSRSLKEVKNLSMKSSRNLSIG